MRNTAAAASIELLIECRHRGPGIPVDDLKVCTLALLGQPVLGLDKAVLTVYLVDAKAMARVNKQHLGHEGSTDVITFPYPRLPDDPRATIRGELFVCVDDARAQARAFGCPWRQELLRYVVHGVLHLCGYDDLQPRPKRIMKRLENSLTRTLSLASPRFQSRRRAES